ncbi:MAG: 2-hydroxychromene-2-carboxylate isomerase [bacterium]|nr:2-hydroxychromene-2-carboxylate isomerase [bacterium]
MQTTGESTAAEAPGSGTQFEFWFEFASTYSYLSAARIRELSAERGVRVVYRPFLLGPIFQAQGWNDSPFNLYPAKGRYMWRDLERRCELYGLPFQKPTEFPRNGLRAARLATALLADPATADCTPAFVAAVYSANFAEDRNIAEESVLIELLTENLAKVPAAMPASPHNPAPDAATIVSRSKSAEIKNALRRTTEQAQELEIFGAPSFCIRRSHDAQVANECELFWGDDRLEDAFDYYQSVDKTQE